MAVRRRERAEGLAMQATVGGGAEVGSREERREAVAAAREITCERVEAAVPEPMELPQRHHEVPRFGKQFWVDGVELRVHRGEEAGDLREWEGIGCLGRLRDLEHQRGEVEAGVEPIGQLVWLVGGKDGHGRSERL